MFFGYFLHNGQAQACTFRAIILCWAALKGSENLFKICFINALSIVTDGKNVVIIGLFIANLYLTEPLAAIFQSIVDEVPEYP